MSELMPERPKVRIAVEGCGHGTLHSIYASVEESCRVKGWDGVDVLIIGGDFQAVRNRYDLNVTAMPSKYRKMADFHEYYSGTRQAPFLTIFIGGNHEASNHLFELYYGGWVAPNIYYMGAANILRLGPLRIAGISGIWKGYDYRKPHFERVPYNEAESVSIFHVRELDVRKMLSVQTQVDIGLSHDWPQGVEFLGDSQWLFRKKDRFEADANQGKLGSVAARQCLDRLRPSHWFSAHLHIKYAALIQHGEYEPIRPQHEQRSRLARVDQQTSSRADSQQKTEAVDRFSGMHTGSSIQGEIRDRLSRVIDRSADETRSTSRPLTTANLNHEASPSPKTPLPAQVSAWQNFHMDASKAEAQATKLRLEEQKEQAAAEERTGVRSSPQYMFDETWKQVKVDDRVERGIAAVSKSLRSPGEDTKMVSVDGCVESKLKRPRSTSSDGIMKNGQTTPPPKLRDVPAGQLDGHVPAAATKTISASRNADEIEIDLSDTPSEDGAAETELSRSNSIRVISANLDGGTSQASHPNPNKRAKSEVMMSDDSDEGGVKLDPTSPPFVPKARASFTPSLAEEPVKEEPGAMSDTMEEDQEKVSDVMRAQLAELSNSFAPVSTQQPVTASLPLPEGITNTTTQFLALDKCERGRDFLQLIEVESITEQLPHSGARPYGLEYDKEWLAILRVFAPELALGGDPNEKVPLNRGDTYYRERILAEQEWIGEHVVKTGRLSVPQNFALTAPIYDPNEEVAPSDKPREYPSPQTSTFCDLIGIENKFDISEEERELREARGPRPAERIFTHGDRGTWRGGRESSNNARGRGNNAGRSGRGRGRGGRGRGRGKW